MTIGMPGLRHGAPSGLVHLPSLSLDYLILEDFI